MKSRVLSCLLTILLLLTLLPAGVLAAEESTEAVNTAVTIQMAATEEGALSEETEPSAPEEDPDTEDPDAAVSEEETDPDGNLPSEEEQPSEEQPAEDPEDPEGSGEMTPPEEDPTVLPTPYTRMLYPFPGTTPVKTAKYLEVSAVLLSAMQDLETRVDLTEYELTPQQLGFIYWNTLDQYPHLFYPKNNFRYYYRGEQVTAIEIGYYYGQTTIEKARDTYERYCQSIVNRVNPKLSTGKKLLALHDYLIKRAEYDTRVYTDPDSLPATSVTAYGVLVKKTGVCESYARIYKELCNRLGIRCVLIRSEAMNHVWNLVHSGGYWYHVDLTWDDPISTDGSQHLIHSNFICSDEEIRALGHFGYYSQVQAADTRYDGYYAKKLDGKEADKASRGRFTE